MVHYLSCMIDGLNYYRASEYHTTISSLFNWFCNLNILVFVRLPIYCVYTQFLKNISTFLSFFTFLPAPLVSILSFSTTNKFKSSKFNNPRLSWFTLNISKQKILDLEDYHIFFIYLNYILIQIKIFFFSSQLLKKLNSSKQSKAKQSKARVSKDFTLLMSLALLCSWS